MKLELTKEELNNIRGFIVDNIMRNPDVMFSNDRYFNTGIGEIDLIEVIASLYEILHQMVCGETYRYMFHWANKCGAWVEDNVFDAFTLEGKEWK